jgi:hypothetical protein
VFKPITVLRPLFCLLVLAGSAGHAMAAAACAPDSPAYFHKYFAGKIADKYAFKMDLKCVEGALTGYYEYVGKGGPLNLKGTMGSAGSFSLEESRAYREGLTGSFSGVLAGDRISGDWRSGDGKKTLSFAAAQTSEIRIGSKKDILRGAVGDFVLEIIEGSGGANAMWDTWKEGGRWRSNVSGISAGMRQAEETRLTRADIRLLDSLKIKVRPDLAIQLLANGNTMLEIPFLASGMDYKVKPLADPIGKDELKQLSRATTVLDETLYLYAHDDVDLSNALAGKFEATPYGILIVRYDMVGDNVELVFLNEQCCGGTTYRFTRQGKRPAP